MLAKKPLRGVGKKQTNKKTQKNNESDTRAVRTKEGQWQA